MWHVQLHPRLIRDVTVALLFVVDLHSVQLRKKLAGVCMTCLQASVCHSASCNCESIASAREVFLWANGGNTSTAFGDTRGGISQPFFSFFFRGGGAGEVLRLGGSFPVQVQAVDLPWRRLLAYSVTTVVACWTGCVDGRRTMVSPGIFISMKLRRTDCVIEVREERKEDTHTHCRKKLGREGHSLAPPLFFFFFFSFRTLVPFIVSVQWRAMGSISRVRFFITREMQGIVGQASDLGPSKCILWDVVSLIFFFLSTELACTVIHFYFGADLISVISVQAFFT